MIKYTILYKNGKTWNGKAETRADIMEYCWNLIKQKRDVLHVTWIENDGDVCVVWPRLNYTGAATLASSILCSDHYNIKPTRAPNPASKTKKQKAFDKAYARWVRDWHLRGSSDITMQAYKKWLWEQKQVGHNGWIPWYGGEYSKCPLPYNTQVEVKFRCGDTNDTLPAGEWAWAGGNESHLIVAYRLLGEENKPVKYSEPKKAPIKVTYTFWLGAFGEVD